VHSLTLYQRPQLTAVSADLANLGSFGFKSARYQDIGLVR
jgi:peptide/nickel transport system substrate-binding protein